MKDAAKSKETVTAREACEMLGGISIMTLRRRVEEGVLTPLPKPAALKRRHVLEFYRADVERLLK